MSSIVQLVDTDIDMVSGGGNTATVNQGGTATNNGNITVNGGNGNIQVQGAAVNNSATVTQNSGFYPWWF